MHRFHSLSLACILWLQAGQSSAQLPPPPQVTFTIASEKIVVNPTQVVFHSTETILPGSAPVSVDGQAVSADPNNDLFVDGTEVITGTRAPATAIDTNIGIPFVALCTQSACIVSEYDLTASGSASVKSGSNSISATGTSTASGKATDTGLGGAPGTDSASTETGSARSKTGTETATVATGLGRTTGSRSATGSVTGSATGSATGPTARDTGLAPSITGSATGSAATDTSVPPEPATGSATTGSKTGKVTTGTGMGAGMGTGTDSAAPGGTSTNAVAPAPSVYSIHGVLLTGNPTSLAVGSTTLTPGGIPLTISGHTLAIPASATGGAISIDGSLTTLPKPPPSTATKSGAVQGSTQGGAAGLSSVYTLNGILFTGNPTRLAVASTTLTPGGIPFVISGHTFAIPTSATGGAISVDGSLTKLPAPATGPGNTATGSATSGASAIAELGPGFGPVASVTLSDASTTATYDAVVISRYTNLQTPTIIATSFPEYNSVGSVTSVFGSIIIGKGGTALVHPPNLPTPVGVIGPPGFGGPIRPPSGSSGCPSFFGISFCPPSINIEPPGFKGGDPAVLPEGTDPQNPDDSENNKKTDQNKTNEPKTKTDSKSQTSASQPSSVKASTTGSASSAATSTAVSTTCTACDVCATYDYAPDATPNPMDDDSNEMRKRALAGRFIHNKRANNYASSVVGSVGSNKCPVARYTQKPQYPGPGVVANNEVNPSPDMKAFYATAIYWAVPTQPPKCGAPGWAFLSTNAIAAANSPWALGGDKKSVNVDHVYEVSILDEFFASQITAGFSCQDITALFDTPDSANSAGSRLNTIFGRLPSLTNPDFLGMDAALNKLKGSFWNPGLQGSKLNSANGHAAVQCLSNLAVVMDIANNAKVASLFSATNGRIHSAFKGVDALITAQEGCGNALKDSNDKPIEATWAASYKAYITNKIAGQNDLITKTAAVLSAAIPTNVDAAKPNQKGNVKDWSAFVSNFNGKYQIKSLTFPEPQDWPDNTLNIQKRHGPACTRKSEANPSGTAGTAGTGTAGKGTETGTGTGKAGGSGSTATSASGSGTVSAGGKPSTITTAPTATSGTGATFSSATPKATSSLFCYPFQDPAAGPAPPRCECGGLDGFYPYLSSTSGATKFNPCGYKTLPTTASASAVPAFTTTEANGKVVSCASSTYYNYAVNTDATCAGSTQVISTVASIASAYSAAAASSVSVASVASASASWASAAAVPSAGCWILSDDGFGDSAFEVYGINGWAGSDGSNLFDQENGCGILSGPEFHTDGQDEFDGRLRNTQYAYFGLSFFKGGCIERAVHSAGGPPPGDGPGQLACQHGPSLSNTQLNAANKILGAQLKAVKAVADGSSATSSLSTNKKVNLAGGSSASSSKPAGGSQPDPSVVESASAALPHLLAAQSGVSAAPASTSA